MNEEQNQYNLLARVVESVVLQPLELVASPNIFRSKIFEGKEAHDRWLFNNRIALMVDCEITLHVEDVKMHAANLSGVYRFLRYTEDDVTNIKLITPVDLDRLGSSHFQKFLDEVNSYFLED